MKLTKPNQVLVLTAMPVTESEASHRKVSISGNRGELRNEPHTLCIALLLLFLSAFSSLLAALDPSQQWQNEDDWWLPEWVTPLPDVVGFYVDNPVDVPVPDQTLELVTFRWKDVNPREGVYDWSILEKALAGKNKIYTRMENSHVIHCPDWLIEKYPDLKTQILTGEPTDDNFGQKTGGTYLPLWHPGLKAEFKKLLTSFKEHGFGANPRLKFSYIPGAWAWGEFDVQFVKEMKAQGMKPEDFMSWWRDIVDAYVDAYGKENAHKLMYTGQDALERCDDDIEWQNAIGRKLFEYVWQKGGSTRFGLLEKFDFTTGDMPVYGVPAKDIGGARYFVVDEENPLIANPQRIIGAENEEIGNRNITWDNYYQLKMTALKSLAIRVNCVFLGAGIWEKGGAVHQYMLKTLGRHYWDSPDAWCALREGRDVYQEWSRYHLGHRGPWIVRNWERWLIQREVEPDGKTVAVYPMKSPVKFNEEAREARRTDLAHGSACIYFGVDDRFMKGGRNAVQIKVTYLDQSKGDWWVEYDSEGEAYKKTTPVKGVDDGKWKTATLVVADAAFQNRQRGGMDFRIVNAGENDLTVRFVRVVRLIPPSDLSPPERGTKWL
jgi:Beta-galactosidase